MNIESILEQAALSFPLILGGYISIFLMQLPDLSIGSAFLSGAVFSSLFPYTDFGVLPLSLGLLGGALVGCISSGLNQLFQIPFLLSSLITTGLFHGFLLFLLGEPLKSIEGQFARFSLFCFSPEVSFLLTTTCILLLIGALLFKSQLGYCLAILGNNPQFFHHWGISTRYILLLGMSISSGLAGLSGSLYSCSNGFVSIDMEYGTLLLCLTSLYLGKRVSKKNPTLLIPVFGVFFYFSIQQCLLSLGLNLTYFSSFQALFILFAIAKRFQSKHVGELSL